MASTNWPPLRLFRHSWPKLTGCTHSEIVDEYGERVYAPYVWKAKIPVINTRAPYECPACTEPDRSHINMLTRPHGASDAVNHAAEPPATNESNLDPTAATFVPRNLIPAQERSFSHMNARRLLAHLRSDPTPHRQHKSSHHRGFPCPDNDYRCHFHHTAAACHLHWQECYQAKRAVQASFNARSDWRGAPKDWNQEHAACIRTENPVRCGWHEELWRVAQPMVLRDPGVRGEGS